MLAPRGRVATRQRTIRTRGHAEPTPGHFAERAGAQYIEAKGRTMTLDNGQDFQLDLGAVKARQQVTWASGDYAIIGTTLQIVGETICEAVDLRSGETVLDAACGNGNAALAAARRFARVTGVDYAPNLLDKAKLRARAEGASIDFVEGDVEALPFEDEAFDVVLSTFGTMFAPNHPVVASELVRTARHGGRIGLANWTPTSFVGAMLRVVGRFVPPPPGLLSPTLWGKREHVSDLFGDRVSSLSIVPRQFVFRYDSPLHFIEVFRAYYGPVHKAFAALDDAGRASLRTELEALLRQHDRSGGASLVVPAEYLEIVAVRR
jgi:SAM-dependent methyltransferase